MRVRVLLLAAAVAGTGVLPAMCFGQTQIVAFGDSLSDPGNASIGTGGAVPGPGYATRSVPGVPFPVGYYTNPQSGSGPSGLWVDQLAGLMGVADPMPFLAPGGGTNYAVASSYTSGMNGLAPGMDLQVATFLAASPAAPSSALYTFWGGSNDVSAGMNPVTAADNIANEIKAVAGAGGKEFLWLNLPPLGDVPAVNGNPVLSAVANQLSAAFDQEWSTDVSALDADGIDVIGVDVDGLISKILADPSAYGFTDVTDDCMTTAGCDPNTFLYWDDEHPTTYADSLLADLAYAELPASTTPSATPEPSSLILLGTTLLGAGILLRKRWIPQPARAV